MKLRTTKKWWQFWIPEFVDISEALIRDAQLSTSVDAMNNAQVLRGRVVKVVGPPDYTPENNVKGGKVVRVMPKQLRKIKEGQENGHS